MTATTTARAAGVLALAAALCLVTLPGEATAAPQSETLQDGHWMAWLGCWTLVNDRVDDRDEEIVAERRVCLRPDATGRGVVVSTQVDDREVLAETLVADGSRIPVDRGGCEGWQQALWSEDGNRLFSRSSLVCEGGGQREVTGISLIGPDGTWLDIEVAAADGQRELMVRRYRFAGSETEGQDLALAGATARVAAREALDAEDVVEAVRQVDPAAVEAALLETNAGFDMNADLLLYLDEAGVPGDLVDLMVALSFPDHFIVDDGTGDQAEAGGGNVGYGYGYGVPVYAYGYWSPFFAPFGHGYYYSPVRPFIGLRPGSLGGKVIKGRGYTRVRTRPGARSGGLSRLFGGGSSSVGRSGDGGASGGSGGTVTPDGHRQGGGSTRTAKPRGEGQDGS